MTTNDAMTTVDEADRIFFFGNPWPGGHSIESFEWTARLEAEGLYFDFTLETAEYSEEDDEDGDYEGEGDASDEDESEYDDDGDNEDGAKDWASKIVWNNYHQCRISSTYWEMAEGMLVADAGNPISLTSMMGTSLTADPLPHDVDAEPAFNIYLLGHDSVADHAIIFDEQFGPLEYALTWSGKIALTYAGHDEFAYEFSAKISSVALTVIEVSESIDGEQAARELLSKYVLDAEKFHWADGIFEFRE